MHQAGEAASGAEPAPSAGLGQGLGLPALPNRIGIPGGRQEEARGFPNPSLQNRVGLYDEECCELKNEFAATPHLAAPALSLRADPIQRSLGVPAGAAKEAAVKGLQELRAGRTSSPQSSPGRCEPPPSSGANKSPRVEAGRRAPTGRGAVPPPSFPRASATALSHPPRLPSFKLQLRKKTRGELHFRPATAAFFQRGLRAAPSSTATQSVRPSVPTCPLPSAAVTARAPAAKCCGNAMQSLLQGKKPFANKPTNQPRAVPRPGLRCRTVSPQRQKIKPSVPTSSGCQLGAELKQSGRLQSFGCGLDRRTGCDCGSASLSFPVPHS